jgi:hypothetical protein
VSDIDRATQFRDFLTLRVKLLLESYRKYELGVEPLPDVVELIFDHRENIRWCPGWTAWPCRSRWAPFSPFTARSAIPVCAPLYATVWRFHPWQSNGNRGSCALAFGRGALGLSFLLVLLLLLIDLALGNANQSRQERFKTLPFR